MNHRQRRAEECRKLFEGFSPNISDKCKNPEKIKQVAALAAEGFYSKEIAEKLNVSAKSIQKIFRYYDFPRLHNVAPPLREERIGWKGGLKVMKGYEYSRTPGHPHGSKYGSYVAVHRLVVEKHLNRYLLPTEVVDHIDGNTRNNNIENLRVFESNAEHLRVTLKGKRPNWSEDGKRRISEAASRARLAEIANQEVLRNDAGQYMTRSNHQKK